MQIKYAFFCEAATTDASGKLSALGIFTEISTDQFPLIYKKIVYVAGIEGRRSEAGVHKLKINFINEDGIEIMPPTVGEIETLPDKPNTNIIFDLTGVTFPHPGIYSLDLVLDNQLLRAESLKIMQRKA